MEMRDHRRWWLFRFFNSGVLIIALISGCLEKTLDPLNDNTPQGTIWKLNKNVDGLKKLASACMEVDSITFFSINYNEDRSVLYGLNLKVGGSVELFSEIVSEEIQVPELSMEKDDDVFFWTINGVFLTDSDGNRVSVTDMTKPVTFYLRGEVICCRVKDSIVSEYPFTKADYLAKDVAIDYDDDLRAFNVHLSSGFITTLPTVSQYQILENHVQNQSFYKDVFLDAGIGLSAMSSLSAAKYLNLSLEGICLSYYSGSAKDRALQQAVISGDSKDSNGRLLYPDGQPRYKLLFVCGGDSKDHGQSLGENGLKNMRTFVENSGCYVGTCAGAFLASNGFDGHVDYDHYLSLWPGMMRHTGLVDTYTGMFIEKDSPLLNYYDYGGDQYVDSLRHNYGGYAETLPKGTEVLARYDYPSKKKVHNSPSVWSYKESAMSGRVVLTGSHPEMFTHGERRDLAAAMMRYALEGIGATYLKGFLKNGEKRIMDKATEDREPSFTRIGDRQTHHFATFIPSDAKNIRVELSSSSNCDFSLMMSHASYAFSETAEYQSTIPGPKQQLYFSSIPEGFWFIGVQCLTTVTVKQTDTGQEYSGNTAVLNGIPYQVSISWD